MANDYADGSLVDRMTCQRTPIVINTRMTAQKNIFTNNTDGLDGFSPLIARVQVQN